MYSNQDWGKTSTTRGPNPKDRGAPHERGKLEPGPTYTSVHRGGLRHVKGSSNARVSVPVRSRRRPVRGPVSLPYQEIACQRSFLFARRPPLPPPLSHLSSDRRGAPAVGHGATLKDLVRHTIANCYRQWAAAPTSTLEKTREQAHIEVWRRAASRVVRQQTDAPPSETVTPIRHRPSPTQNPSSWGRVDDGPPKPGLTLGGADALSLPFPMAPARPRCKHGSP